MWSWFSSKELAQRPRSKSRTILRVISTTFRSRSPISPTSPPPASTDLQAKQTREAALRERGLLPPLQPPKDLSRQEADQDRRIPVVAIDRKSGDSFIEPSAADLIKREWEAKNKPADSAASTPSTEAEERERMKAFRFGAPSPSSAEFPQIPELEIVAEVDTPLPSPLSNDGAIPPPVPEKDPPRGAPSHRSSASVDHGSVDPSSVPLPSSPLPTPPPTPSKPTNRKSTSISSATNPPPTSFHLSRYGDVDTSSSYSGHNRSSSQRSSSSAPPTTPIISLTPPSHVISESSSLASSSPHRRSESLSKMPSISESASSLMTPSLDPSSRTITTISTLNTAESQSLALGTTCIGGQKGKANMLRVKTTEHKHNIPMIVESPVEDILLADPEAMIPEAVPLPLSPVSEGHSDTLVVPQTLAPLRRGRGLTNPEKGDKRMSFNPFKRGQSLGPDESGGKRLSVSASLMNLKRAATSFTTRPKSTFYASSVAPSSKSAGAITSAKKTFDASHLPPSPTLPTRFVTPGAGTGAGLRVPSRRPLEPTLHSRGSILMETNAIQDEEVRRMTELAFLG
ncbi:hypothetical protein P691DRAFT_45695 [Macrolepiota fuliginosa MF-IS2]|uniref:Uncharacterized protein n=1 Tax=Macrolepiota fuliginosa MF-IS2 TaxID=1400762 RepID=A0A9P5XMI6_9AGAR|nr:hypothetical protein P691DRAFT_45695 [Macrolepiota fuliginosa MF-IS2]